MDLRELLTRVAGFESEWSIKLGDSPELELFTPFVLTKSGGSGVGSTIDTRAA